FNCTAPNGAVLALPHGGQVEKLRPVRFMREYAAKNAESWYKYLNGTKGFELMNGSLLLITGCEKAKSWGMAMFHNVSPQIEFPPLSFRPTTDVQNSHKYHWQGAYCHWRHADPPVDDSPLNQTTFIHAFTIS
ncbi:hypothetical protein DFH08DRAFT_674588, partial [Mycena albidolilacea]